MRKSLITINNDGMPYITGTWVSVRSVIDLHRKGKNLQEIKDNYYIELTDEQILAALNYRRRLKDLLAQFYTLLSRHFHITIQKGTLLNPKGHYIQFKIGNYYRIISTKW